MAGKLGMFEFYWKIEKFNRCLPWMKLESPSFEVDYLDKTRWHLVIYFRGDLDPISISLELCREKDGIPLTIDLKYELSFRDKSDFPFAKHASKYSFSAGSAAGFGNFFQLSEVLGPKMNDLLSEGSLATCCQLERTENGNVAYTLCSGRSRLGLEGTSHMWVIDGFDEFRPGQTKILPVHTTSKNVPSLALLFFLEDDGDKIRIKIQQDYICKSNMCQCEISLVDAKGKVAFSKRDRFWFGSSKGSKRVWDFPVFLRKSELMANRDLYLPNGKLNLRYDWKIDSGIAFSRIESYSKKILRKQEIMISMDPIDYEE